MAQFANMFEVNLDSRSYPVSLVQTVSEGNVYSNRIGAYVYADGAPVNLGGACTGLVMRADGTTVPLTGYVEGNAAYVVLDQPSCAIPGPIQVAVNSVVGENITTLLVAYGTVIQTDTRNYVEPGTPLPDITELLAEIDNMREATAAAEAAATKAVRYDEAQSLTDAQKTTARDNIDAVGDQDLSQFEGFLGRTDDITWTDEYFIAADDSIISNANYSYTDYVDVRNLGAVMLVTYITDYAGLVLYDANKTRIGGYRNSLGVPMPYFRFLSSAEIPNLAFIRFSCKTANKSDYMILKFPLTSVINTNVINYMKTNIPDWAKNANNLQSGTFFAIRFGWYEGDLTNYPFTNFQGTIITYKGAPTGDLTSWGFQIAIYEGIETTRPKILIRTRYTSWGNWIGIADQQTTSYKNNLYSIFDPVGVIGDSLASGECYTSDGSIHPDFYGYSWLQFMCREVGATGYNFSVGGMTAKAWLTNSRGYPMASQSDKLCKAYFIGLGQNDANQSYTIGTIYDINVSDYTLNADTFYGNYGGIIQRMKALVPDAKFFLITDPLGASSETREAYNVAIRAICEHFTNCYLIDLSADYSTIFLSGGGFIQANNSYNHYSAAAYKYIANIISDIVDDIILNNPADFKYVQFIGYEQ